MSLCYGLNKKTGSQLYAIITTEPEKIPPVPTPAIALPTIRATLVGATPHISEPSSKTQMAVKKVALI
jgi:hypothetical protein